MPAINRAIVIQSTNSTGGISAARAGIGATVEVVGEQEKWVVDVARGFLPKIGDRILPIATATITDKKPRTITAVSETDGKYTLTCDVPKKE